jgi:alditol oxidase
MRPTGRSATATHGSGVHNGNLATSVAWQPDPAAVKAALKRVEAALAPFGGRPHWGKLFLANAETLAPRYERHGDFVALIERLDPRRAFRNEWLEEHVLWAG